MGISVILCVVLATFAPRTRGFLLFDSPNQHCGVRNNVTHIRIPTGIDLKDFDSIIEGNEMGEMYYALPTPPAYVPDINYFSVFHKLNNTHYVRKSIAETPTSPSNCTDGTLYMHVLPGYITAQFHMYGDFYPENHKHITLQVIWSTCLRKYFWSMRCKNFNPGNTTCLRSQVSFGLYVAGSLDDLPLPSILHDLSKTGVEFGSDDFKWTFTYGENRVCDRRKLNNAVLLTDKTDMM